MTAAWGGKLVAGLTDRGLSLAETDVANCLLRAYEAPDPADEPKYRQYFEKMSDLANAIQAEKVRRVE